MIKKIKKKFSYINWNSLFLFIILIFCLFASYSVIKNTPHIKQTHFTDLAFSFLNKKLSLIPPVPYTSWLDSASFRGKNYVYFGPLPALLYLIPVAIFGKNLSQHYLGLALIPIVFYLIFQIGRRLKLKKLTALWLAVFFVFGTVFIFLALINVTAYQVQVIGIAFFLTGLYEFLGKRRWLIIGVLLALAGATRFTLFLGAFFFLCEICFSKQPLKNKIVNILSFLMPLFITLELLALYNYLRFGNFLDTGYVYNASWGKDLINAASHGIFSLKHVAGNLYFLLLKGPEPVRLNRINFVLKFPYLKVNQWGMGIFFTSPLFLYLFTVKRKFQYFWSSLVTAVIILIPLLTYYGLGVWQFGYRYALDLYPLLFILLAQKFRKKFPFLPKLIIFLSVLFNFAFMLSIWDIYPLW